MTSDSTEQTAYGPMPLSRGGMGIEDALTKTQVRTTIVALLNRVLAADPEAFDALVTHRVPCNEALRSDPSLVFLEDKLGVLGLVSGITRELKLPAIAMRVDVSSGRIVAFGDYEPGPFERSIMEMLTGDDARFVAAVQEHLQQMADATKAALEHNMFDVDELEKVQRNVKRTAESIGFTAAIEKALQQQADKIVAQNEPDEALPG